MSTLIIGTKPERMIVQLEQSTDFYGTLTRSTDWITGATLALIFDDGTTIPATISGSTATFDMPVPAGGWTPIERSGVVMAYTEPDGSDTFHQTIAKGTVRIV